MRFGHLIALGMVGLAGRAFAQNNAGPATVAGLASRIQIPNTAPEPVRGPVRNSSGSLTPGTDVMVKPGLYDPSPGETGPGVPAFQVRSGFKVTLVAENIGEARFLALDANGTLYVAQPNSGTIATLRPKDGKYEKVADFVTDKKSVHGLCYFDGWLWFTQSGAVWKARDTTNDGKADEEVKILDNLPNGGHWWRSILVTKDGFYTSIGDSGNATDQTDTDRQKIWHYNLDGTGKTLFCSGIRNTEKLLFRPYTQELYGCDQGSDWYGKVFGDVKGNQPFTDKIPPCEFNHYTEGAFYGHPFIVGNGMPRPEYQNRPDILDLANKTVLPAWAFGAHWAPDGWCFALTGKLGNSGDAYVANHGSWNSTPKVGYRIERVLFDAVTQLPYGSQRMVSTLSTDGPNPTVLGRPVDCVEEASGDLLFSDDQNRKIFRISPQPIKIRYTQVSAGAGF